MKSTFKQIWISLKLIISRRFTLRSEAFIEWERRVTAATLTDNVDSVFFISDEITREFGWAEMVQMRDRFYHASQSAQALGMKLTIGVRRREYTAARQALQTIPSNKAKRVKKDGK